MSLVTLRIVSGYTVSLQTLLLRVVVRVAGYRNSSKSKVLGSRVLGVETGTGFGLVRLILDLETVVVDVALGLRLDWVNLELLSLDGGSSRSGDHRDWGYLQVISRS